jgi:hypothetical protein
VRNPWLQCLTDRMLRPVARKKDYAEEATEGEVTDAVAL